jgi:hypothetical protein
VWSGFEYETGEKENAASLRTPLDGWESKSLCYIPPAICFSFPLSSITIEASSMMPTTLNTDSNDSGIMNRLRSNAVESYYGNVSHAEWCHNGTLALLRFRRKQSQRQVSFCGTILAIKGSNDTSKANPKKRPPSSCWAALPLKKRVIASSPLLHETDLLTISPASTMETAVVSSAASLDGSRGCIPHSPEPLMDLEDDGNNIDAMVMDDDELSLQQEATTAYDNASEKFISNAAPNPSLPVAPSPFFSFWKRWQPTKTKKQQECFGRRQKPDPNSGMILFNVKEKPPQCIAFIEGICDAVHKNPTGDQNYFASPHYHYLSDLLDYGQHDLVPRRGISTEIPSASPAYPGPWIAQIFPPHSPHLDPSLPTRQSDWNGSRIRLVHQEYERRLPPCCTEKGTDGGCSDPGISMVRIDPAIGRMILQQHDDQTDGLFIGAMAVVMFDGFASTAESSVLQGPLAECILHELHHSLVGKESTVSPMLRSTILGIDVFTTKQGLSLRPSESVSGCGGIALPVSISCGGATAKRSRDDYHLLLYSCETMNSIVAIESKSLPACLPRPGSRIFLTKLFLFHTVVFDEAPVVRNEQDHMKSSSSPIRFDGYQGLTQKQLDHHASTCSAMNVLHLWKQQQNIRAATTPAPEEMDHCPLTSGGTTCFGPSSKSAGSDAMSEVFAGSEEEEENPASMISSSLPPTPSTFASAENTVLNSETKGSVAPICLDTLPKNTFKDAITVTVAVCEDEESHAAVLKADLPNSPSTCVNAVMPTINLPQYAATEVHGQKGVAATVMTCLSKESVASTVIQAHRNRSDILLNSALTEPFHQSLNHVTPTPYRPTAALPPSRRGADANVIEGKHLFPETEMKQRMPVPVASTIAVLGGVQLEEYMAGQLNAMPEGSTDAAPELASPDVIVSKNSEEGWPSWLSVFYGLHDEQEFPEMTQDELVDWIHNLAIENVAAPVCLHDALFGWALDEFNHDDDASVPWFFYNWFIPLVTWGATVLLIWLVHSSMVATTLIPSPAAVITDSSHFLLSPLLFEVTGLGYVGMVRID